ncbi:MAG: hypothetical protein JKY70_00190 [Mucilaginibacter sp.]|nr:hypothetical protein [Mucilaginibacter sp.]
MDEKIDYWHVFNVFFYLIFIALTIFSGKYEGNSHTPPGWFVVEFCLMPVAILLLVTDLIRHRRIYVHIYGISGNLITLGLMIWLTSK